MIRVRPRVRYLSRDEKKLYLNHVKQLKGEIKLLTSTKGMTKLTLLSMGRTDFSAICQGTVFNDGREFSFFETSSKLHDFLISYIRIQLLSQKTSISLYTWFSL